MRRRDNWRPGSAATGGRSPVKEDRTGATGTSLLIIEGGVSWNSSWRSHEAGLSTAGTASSWAGVRMWLGLAWLASEPACSLRGASRTLCRLAGLGYTTCQLAALASRPAFPSLGEAGYIHTGFPPVGKPTGAG